MIYVKQLYNVNNWYGLVKYYNNFLLVILIKKYYSMEAKIKKMKKYEVEVWKIRKYHKNWKIRKFRCIGFVWVLSMIFVISIKFRFRMNTISSIIMNYEYNL